MEQQSRNRVFFGLGTIGRDMSYTLVSMYLIYYLTDVLNLSDRMMWGATAILTVLRVFDALNDPFMGLVVDNTDTRYGKFKPGILAGAVIGGMLALAMFTDFGLTGGAYLLAFGLTYLAWDITYGINDIAYWSMLPTLSVDQKEREKAGAFARICGNIGMYLVVVGCMPLTAFLAERLGGQKNAWFTLALATTLCFLLFQLFTLFGVRERRELFKKQEKTSLRDMAAALIRNDQLLYTTLSMALFMIGYMTTTSFGVYFFKYAYGDEGMYAVFAMVLGVAQLSALSVFPLFSKRFSRKKLYFGATVLVILGYVVFFFSPMHMVPIGIAGLLMFIGQAFIQLLMLMFLADTIEYGQWKLGRRNEAITFPSAPHQQAGRGHRQRHRGRDPDRLGHQQRGDRRGCDPGGHPADEVRHARASLAAILLGYWVYFKKFRIDERFYQQMLEDLRERGELRDHPGGR